MNRNPEQDVPTERITLDEIRALIQSDPPVGAELAQASNYNSQTLAQKCGCSVRRLEQVFRETHRTPHDWLQEHKLSCEAEQLVGLQLTGDLDSVKRLTFDWGYHHPDHFRRAFKAVFHMSPRAFLIEHKKALERAGIKAVACRGTSG